MPCPACLADPQPPNFTTPRKCAFDDATGEFKPDNWRCATIDKISDRNCQESYGDDETCYVYTFAYEEVRDLSGVAIRSTCGFIVLTRYKQRGRVQSATWVGLFCPPRHLNLSIADSFLDYKQPTDYSER